ncbi:MAG TPA: NAD(P)H-dependent oxidoreductase [Acidisarcina sp.]|nr:NAD(P)H-dependent oxidoreductase [Acidisarcina sp.]
MAKLLVIESSPRSESVSSQLTTTYVQQWREKNSGGTVKRHNVALQPPPPVTEAWINAAYTPPDARTADQQELLAPSDGYVQDLIDADTIILGAPMWNFSISAPLKAWIDQVVRVGRTFNYTSEGPKGLLDSSKKVIVVAARGGAYSGDSAYASLDFQEPYLRMILGFIGLTNVKFVYAENLSRGGEAAALGIKSGEEALLQLV